jgi:hypothetical protein
MVVSLSGQRTGRALLQRHIFLLLILVSLRRRVKPRPIVRPEGLGKFKFSFTSLRLGPATFRLVSSAACWGFLSHRYCVTNWVPFIFLCRIPFYLQASQLHSANGVKLRWRGEECSVALLHNEQVQGLVWPQGTKLTSHTLRTKDYN